MHRILNEGIVTIITQAVIDFYSFNMSQYVDNVVHKPRQVNYLASFVFCALDKVILSKILPAMLKDTS